MGKLLIIFLLPTIVLGGEVNFLPTNKRYAHRKKFIPTKKSIVREVKKGIENLLLGKISDQNEEIKEILKVRSALPVIIDNTLSYPTGTIFKGTLLNSVVSTNLESPMLVSILPRQKLAKGTLFSCIGTTKHKRVVSSCNLMIKDNIEYEVSASLLNTDGSSGIKGEYFEGKEAYIAGMLAADISKGILSVSQTRVATNLGSITKANVKNQILQGLIGGADTGVDILKEEMKTKEPVVVINAGVKVLIYFNRRFTNVTNN
ncbi:MAG: hypothetical protein ISR65_02865 [Bacteriovoracaceae bacterium]|nr:hypothetical protein [Bacteriovoracaceae bacterium]